MVGFERAMENIDTTVKSAQTFVNRYNEVMSKDIEQSMNRLFDGPFQRKVRRTNEENESVYVKYTVKNGCSAQKL